MDDHSSEDMGHLSVMWGSGTEKDSRKKLLDSHRGEMYMKISH